MAKRVEVPQHLAHARGLVERHLTRQLGAGQAARDGDRRCALRQLGPVAARRADRCDQEAVDTLGSQARGERKLLGGVAIGIGQDRMEPLRA
jgi:hypothetical protein